MCAASLLQHDQENREHLKHFRNVYCITTNHSKDQDTSKPQNLKLINILACGLVFSGLIGFFSCTTKTFQKYFRCSQFSQLCNDHRIGKNCFHFFNQNEVFCSGFFQLTFGVNSSIQELGDVITKVPPGATRDGNLSRNWYGLGRRQTKFAARTQPNCPKSDGKLQASP